jgi:adenosine deaminase
MNRDILVGLYELHRHADTSHSPESISRVAKSMGIKHYAKMSVDAIRREIQAPKGATWKEWYEYLKKVRKTYVSPEAVAELIRDVIRDAWEREKLGLLELRVGLMSTVWSIMENINMKDTRNFIKIARKTINAILAVREDEIKKTPLPVDFIFSISCRNKYLHFLDQCVDLIRDYAKDICAVDLTHENENKPSTCRRELRKIRTKVKFLAVHCMETTGPYRWRDALSLFPQRLGHGIRVMESPALVNEIVKRKIILEMCPLSNILTGVATKENHPFRQLEEAGVLLAICHDGLNDGSTLYDDYQFVQSAFGYADEDMLRFAENARRGAFRNMKA